MGRGSDGVIVAAPSLRACAITLLARRRGETADARPEPRAGLGRAGRGRPDLGRAHRRVPDGGCDPRLSPAWRAACTDARRARDEAHPASDAAASAWSRVRHAAAPESDDPKQRGSGKLSGKVALITGGDSGIGRAVAIAFAKEGADVGIVYLDEHDDAKETKRLVEEQGGRCVLVAGDIGDEAFCKRAVARVVKALGGLDILVNNAAEQHPQEKITDISPSSSSGRSERTSFRCSI